MISEVFVSKSNKETFNYGKEFSRIISVPVLIGVNGELGSGKTTFIKGLAYGLGVKDLIASPTFLGISESICKGYKFAHMDFYKKVVPKKVINGYLKDNSIVIIEWIENYFSIFQNKLGVDWLVYIQYLKDKKGSLEKNKRQILIKKIS